MSWIQWVTPVLGAAVGALATVGASWLKARHARPAADKTADATMQGTILEGFSSLVKGLQDDVKLLRGELSEARDELEQTRHDMAQLKLHVARLETVLREHGLAEQIPPWPIRKIAHT